MRDGLSIVIVESVPDSTKVTNRKHDLDTDEIGSENVSDGSKITPRLRVEFVGVIVALDLEGIKRVGSETLESC